jgi:SAM-dependent methyltransferase
MSERIPPALASTSLESSSLSYWKSMDGGSYREMLRTREGQGNGMYTQQERFLTTLLQAEQRRLRRPLDVLEFGCGFGRHAAYLSSLQDVRYHGYDFSESMVAPLRQAPPVALGPLDGRLFVGGDPVASVGERRFDLVFTVSVLIHNPTESIPGLLETLGRLVRPDGMVCLVENPLVPFGVWGNGWHEGCWLHAYAEALGPGWDLHHGPGFVEGQDVYLLKRNSSNERRYFHLTGPEQARDESQPLTPESLQSRSLPRLRAWATSASHVLRHGASSTDARVTELQERLEVEAERSQRRQRLMSLAEELASLRNHRTVVAQGHEVPPAPSGQRPGVLFNDAADTAWAHVHAGMSGVMHVFHQEWHGIRAAAGYSPGHKLAITAERSLTPKELRRAVELCESSGCRVVIVHSFSSYAHEFIVALRKVLGRSIRIYCVWHGSTAQFHHDYEFDVFAGVMDLSSQGLLQGVACVKPDMHLVANAIYPKTLLNLPPRVEPALQRPSGTRSGSALIPTPNDWRKNFYTNLYACMAARQLQRVYVTTRFIQPRPLPFPKPVLRLERPSRSELFELLRGKVDVVLNASLSECQPMTALEGLALRVPCVTGPLGLGELDAHPYQRLMQVERVDVVGAVRDAVEAVLDLQERSPQELRAMMDDYERLLCRESLRRYEEFIHS